MPYFLAFCPAYLKKFFCFFPQKKLSKILVDEGEGRCIKGIKVFETLYNCSIFDYCFKFQVSEFQALSSSICQSNCALANFPPPERHDSVCMQGRTAGPYFKDFSGKFFFGHATTTSTLSPPSTTF